VGGHTHGDDGAVGGFARREPDLGRDVGPAAGRRAAAPPRSPPVAGGRPRGRSAAPRTGCRPAPAARTPAANGGRRQSAFRPGAPGTPGLDDLTNDRLIPTLRRKVGQANGPGAQVCHLGTRQCARPSPSDVLFVTVAFLDGPSPGLRA
jgi:hypothetical protein